MCAVGQRYPDDCPAVRIYSETLMLEVVNEPIITRFQRTPIIED